MFIGELDLQLQKGDEAERAFERALEKSPNDAEIHKEIGDAYSRQGHYEEAEVKYRAALDIDPNIAHVFNNLGIAYRKQRKFDKALDLYGTARMHHPEDEHLLFNIARTHFESGQNEKAEAILREAIQLAPEFKQARLFLEKLETGGDIVELDLDE